jgi:methylenetetrahydrofolate dehydrogenase (NADP+)/methenyltetrahydrofolate cyclohydrolase
VVDLDGKALADRIRRAHAPAIAELRAGGRAPRLLSLQVGGVEASEAYVRGQRRGAEAWGIEYETRVLPAGVDESAVRSAIDDANADPRVSGVLLQLPLPANLPARVLQHAIHPDKDVEGVHPENLGTVVHGQPRLAPCTALAVIALLEESGAPIRGAEAVVVGHSEIVGKPVGLLLLAHDATTTVCHKYTRDLASHTRRADLLVVAVGKAGLVTADMVKPGAVVVDVGINAVPVPDEPGRMRIVGDVDYDAVTKAGARVSPVPGGVGPVTVAMLLRNTLIAARRQFSTPEVKVLPRLRPVE